MKGSASKMITFGGPCLLLALGFLTAKVQAMTGFLAVWFEKQRNQAL